MSDVCKFFIYGHQVHAAVLMVNVCLVSEANIGLLPKYANEQA